MALVVVDIQVHQLSMSGESFMVQLPVDRWRYYVRCLHVALVVVDVQMHELSGKSLEQYFILVQIEQRLHHS